MSCLKAHVWKPAYKVQGIISFCRSLFILWGRKKGATTRQPRERWEGLWPFRGLPLQALYDERSVKTWDLIPSFPFLFSSSPWWFPSLILLLLQFMASGLVLWLNQDALTKPQIAAEFLCPSTKANLGTAHEALFKINSFTSLPLTSPA